MGHSIAQITLTNADDRAVYERGFIQQTEIRSHEMEALVDTGAVLLALPQDVVEHLGLRERSRMTFVLADESRQSLVVAGPLYIEILGREMVTDCVVLPPAAQVLIGHLVLERLDLLLLDSYQQTITVRPESPLRPMLNLK